MRYLLVNSDVKGSQYLHLLKVLEHGAVPALSCCCSCSDSAATVASSQLSMSHHATWVEERRCALLYRAVVALSCDITCPTAAALPWAYLDPRPAREAKVNF